MKRYTLLMLAGVAACLLALGALGGFGPAEAQTTSTVTTDEPTTEELELRIVALEGELALVRDRLGATRATLAEVRSKLDRANRLRLKHKRRAARLYRTLHPQPASWLADARCIHRHEGSWTDPNAPYWGGMQMDRSFMSSYGRRWYEALGTADHWRPSVQLLVSWRGYLARGGFNPWPNTARECGAPLFV